jgi:aryl-alcohol dehydrogenase-like predicted oxidoreductase
MGMSDFYGPADEAESIATIHAAIDAGVTLIDTGDFYGAGRNELLLAKALRGRRDRVLISVKFGALRGPDRSWLGFDGRPAAVKNFLSYTLARLGVDYIDIYRPSRHDPSVPIEETVGAIADCVKAGWVRAVGLSEVGAETIRRAHTVHPINDLQIEYSLISRGPEAKIFPVLRELGISVTAYGVLSRGLLSGSRPKGKGDYRSYLPRFSADQGPVLAALGQIAADKGITPSQLAIAWVLSRGDDIVPLIGSRTRAQLTESLAALQVSFSPSELAHIESTMPPAIGSRYQEEQMRRLDSER